MEMGREEIKKDAFWMISVSACIYYTSLGTEASCTLTAREKSMAEESSSFNFFVTKEINNLFLLRKELREILF